MISQASMSLDPGTGRGGAEPNSTKSGGQQPAAGMSKICLEWWDDLTGFTNSKTRNSGQIAEMRRARDVLEVSFCPAYNYLIRRMTWLDGKDRAARRTLDRLAVAACVLAHVRDHTPDMTIARQMALPEKGKSTSAVSELRFRRLMQVRTNDELIAALRRTVSLLGNRVNVADLSDFIVRWEQPTRMKNTAFDYYAAAPEK
jgi:CRISPR type I-E-associated protein CasB/Cse2